ncbi:DUF3363 domain-containing protein [Bradyrhizobium elkanii]|uniref:DUF3363 domain-containing protein n=1 Tax=Bradyrhizobium elkanii TaxID=29448 RepID=UPI001FD75A23|nr:DUF3363 domain-containing protein [Bradyrhizobium elkanii]
MHRELRAAGISRAAASYAIFDPRSEGRRLIGRVVGEGFVDELTERRYVVIDGGRRAGALCRGRCSRRQRRAARAEHDSGA